LRLLFGFRQCRQHHGGQNGDNRHDDEQFNETERTQLPCLNSFHNVPLLLPAGRQVKRHSGFKGQGHG
jgi:hypothetical protein